MIHNESKGLRVSMRDIAKAVGVSHATVSMALRNKPSIPESTRQRIRNVAEELGYSPDPMLAALNQYNKTKRSERAASIIGWINTCPDYGGLRAGEELDSFWQGAASAAARAGYQLKEYRVEKGLSSRDLKRKLVANGVRGLLLPPQVPTAGLEDFPWHDYSLVRLGCSETPPGCHCVAADRIYNICLAVARMREAGYRRIGVVCLDHMMTAGREFPPVCSAVRQTMSSAEKPAIFDVGRFAETERPAAFRKWIHEQRPDALFTNLNVTRGVLENVKLKVPPDMGIAMANVRGAGVDCGIDPQFEEIGRIAFLILKSMIMDGIMGVPDIPRRTLVAGTWVAGKADLRTSPSCC